MGLEQAETYKAKIDHAIELLTYNPRIGRPRVELGQRLNCFPVERHLIFCRTTPDEIEIVRVLHERSDARLHCTP